MTINNKNEIINLIKFQDPNTNQQILFNKEVDRIIEDIDFKKLKVYQGIIYNLLSAFAIKLNETFIKQFRLGFIISREKITVDYPIKYFNFMEEYNCLCFYDSYLGEVTEEEWDKDDMYSFQIPFYNLEITEAEQEAKFIINKIIHKVIPLSVSIPNTPLSS